MRHSVLITLSVVAMLCGCRIAAAEESSWGWLWPFGHDEASADPYPTTDQPVARPMPRRPDRAALRQKPGRHRIGSAATSPNDAQVTQESAAPLWPGQPEMDQARNAWLEKQPEPESASPWQVVTEGTQRLGESTRNAWHKTVDVLTPEYMKPTQPPAPHTARRDPLWRRALGLGEEEKPEGPQTVTEWMSQERLNP